MISFLLTVGMCFACGLIGAFGGRVLLREDLGSWADSQCAEVTARHTYLTNHTEFTKGYYTAMKDLKMEIRIYD